MSDSQKAAYDAYIASDTKGTKVALPGGAGATSSDFVDFISNFEVIDPASVDTSHLGNAVESKKHFYRTLLSTAFHTYYSADHDPLAKGPGNNVLMRVSRSSAGVYSVTFTGLTQEDVVIELDNPGYLLSSKSLMLDGGATKVILKVTPNDADGEPVYNFQLSRNDAFTWNYYLVPFAPQ